MTDGAFAQIEIGRQPWAHLNSEAEAWVSARREPTAVVHAYLEVGQSHGPEEMMTIHSYTVSYWTLIGVERNVRVSQEQGSKSAHLSILDAGGELYADVYLCPKSLRELGALLLKLSEESAQ